MASSVVGKPVEPSSSLRRLLPLLRWGFVVDLCLLVRWGRRVDEFDRPLLVIVQPLEDFPPYHLLPNIIRDILERWRRDNHHESVATAGDDFDLQVLELIFRLEFLEGCRQLLGECHGSHLVCGQGIRLPTTTHSRSARRVLHSERRLHSQATSPGGAPALPQVAVGTMRDPMSSSQDCREFGAWRPTKRGSTPIFSRASLRSPGWLKLDLSRNPQMDFVMISSTVLPRKAASSDNPNRVLPRVPTRGTSPKASGFAPGIFHSQRLRKRSSEVAWSRTTAALNKSVCRTERRPFPFPVPVS